MDGWCAEGGDMHHDSSSWFLANANFAPLTTRPT